MTHSRFFPHQRLDAYHAAQDLVVACVEVTQVLPRGFAEIRDQARRSALATARHIAEGASRVSPADKRSRFVIARGEVAELDATLETAQRLALVDVVVVGQARQLADRVGAMLTGLIAREARRVRERGR